MIGRRQVEERFKASGGFTYTINKFAHLQTTMLLLE